MKELDEILIFIETWNFYESKKEKEIELCKKQYLMPDIYTEQLQIKLKGYCSIAEGYFDGQLIPEEDNDPDDLELLTKLHYKLIITQDKRDAKKLLQLATNKLARLQQKISAKKIENKSNYELSVKMIVTEYNANKSKLLADFETYIRKVEFKNFVKNLELVSCGKILYPLSLNESLLEVLMKEYPQIDWQKGLRIPFNPNGINFIRYSRDKDINFVIQTIIKHSLKEKKFEKIVIFDAVHFNNSILKELSCFIGSIIAPVPISVNDMKIRLVDILKQLTNIDNLNKTFNKQLFIFHGFSDKYDNVLEELQKIVVNISYYNITLIFTSEYDSLNMKLDLKDNKVSLIEIDDNGNSFHLGNNHLIHNPIEWTDIPSDDFRMKEGDDTQLEKYIDFDHFPNYEKGNREITNIPYGIDEHGKILTLDFENSNFATYICGAARSGKSTLIHTLIMGILTRMHPDDVEIWLIDFKGAEFRKYVNNLPPHVRYIVLDNSQELVFDIIDQLVEAYNIRRARFDVIECTNIKDYPKDKYMPAILVIIDEFPEMSRILAKNHDYLEKLNVILQKSAAYGFKFIFSSQAYDVSGNSTRGLSEFAKGQIQQRMSLKIQYSQMRAALEIQMPSEYDRILMDQLQPHNVLVKRELDEFGNQLVKSEVLYMEDENKLKRYIQLLNSNFKKVNMVKDYDVNAINLYLDKKPVIVNQNQYHTFPDKEQICLSDKKDICVYLGIPKRMKLNYPIKLKQKLYDNMLIFSSTRKIMETSSVIMSIVQSGKMNCIETNILALSDNVFFEQLQSCDLSGIKIKNSVFEICNEIKVLCDKIKQRQKIYNFYLILGLEAIIEEIRNLQWKERNAETTNYLLKEEKVSVKEFSWKEFLEDSANDNKTNDELNLQALNLQNNNSSFNYKDCDLLKDIKYILEEGPMMNCFCFLVLEDYSAYEQLGINKNLFNHKILFKNSVELAKKLVSNSEAEKVSELPFGPVFRYSNEKSNGISYQAFLFKGITLENFTVDSNGRIVNDYYINEEIF